MPQLDIVCATWNMENQVPSLKPLATSSGPLEKRGASPISPLLACRKPSPPETALSPR